MSDDRQEKAGIFDGPPAGLPDPDLMELAVYAMSLESRLVTARRVIEAVERERVLADKLIINQEVMIEALRDTVERQEDVLRRLRAASPEAKIEKWSAEITGKVKELLN